MSDNPLPEQIEDALQRYVTAHIQLSRTPNIAAADTCGKCLIDLRSAIQEAIEAPHYCAGCSDAIIGAAHQVTTPQEGETNA